MNVDNADWPGAGLKVSPGHSTSTSRHFHPSLPPTKNRPYQNGNGREHTSMTIGRFRQRRLPLSVVLLAVMLSALATAGYIYA